MLELGPRELVTLGTVLAGLAATWGVLKATLKSIITRLTDNKKDIIDIYTRLDHFEANQAVALHSIDVMGKDILSPQILKERSERDGATEMRLRSLEESMRMFQHMHNGSHPPLESNKD